MQSRISNSLLQIQVLGILKKGVENQDTYHQDPGNLVTGF